MRQPIIQLKEHRKTRGQHAGLLLQRYLCEDATGDKGKPEEKRAILQAAINAAANQEVCQLYEAAFQRWEKSFNGITKSHKLQTLGRLIVGLGSENVLETGIRLHHTYGLPILPGSALKGLASHFCAQVWGTTDAEFKNEGKQPGRYHQLLFGSTEDSGCLVFHDAWFVPGSTAQPLKLDVMTPHHPDWLDGKVAPTDFDSPIPVQFLSVTGSFLVAVSWQGPAHPHAEKWTALTLTLLQQALTEWGIGGKTTSGYGRLVDPATVPAEAKKPEVQTPSGPRYSPGDQIPVTREEHKGKPKFRADDGFLGHFVPPEEAPAGNQLTVWVANRNAQGYTFTMKQPTVKTKSPKKGGQGKHHKKGGH